MVIRKKINYFEQPPKVAVSIAPESDSIVRQTYNVASGQTYPNRTLVPLVLTPLVSYIIPDTGERNDNAASLLTDGHWFRYDNATTAKGGLEITDGSVYEIDSAAGSPTYGQIRIKENVSPGNPVTYRFQAVLNIGGGYPVSASFRVDCDKIEVMPQLYFTGNTRGLYNPWDSSDPRKVTVTPAISPASLPATYEWLMHLDEDWVPLGSDLRDWAVDVSGTGVVIDRALMPDSIELKCVASVTVGSSTVKIEGIVTHTRRLPYFEYDIINVADITHAVKTLNPKCLLRTNNKVIENPGEEAKVDWYGSGSTPIAEGMSPSIPVSSLGSAMELGVEVTDAGGYKLFLDDDGVALQDDDGLCLLVK